jgi:nuclear pore complex protein Nup98-Nup96
VREFTDAKPLILEQMESGSSNQEQQTSMILLSDKGDSVSASLIYQLENYGLWDWAILVALFLNDLNQREIVIRSLLARHYPYEDHSGSWCLYKQLGKPVPEYSSTWKFLVGKLKVPTAWIHEARCLQAKYRRDVLQEVVSLIDARRYDACHHLLIEQVCPPALLSGKLLSNLSQTL